MVEGLGRTFTPLKADFSVREQVTALAADLAGRDVDVLVNNGGTIRRAPAAEHTDEDFDYVVDVNLRSTFVLSREVGRSMIARGGGKIVNTASLLSFQGGVNVPGYTSSKSAVAGLTKALANEWAPLGVNVNAVAPGYVATANTTDLRADADAQQGDPRPHPGRALGRRGRHRRGGPVPVLARRGLRPRHHAPRRRWMARPMTVSDVRIVITECDHDSFAAEHEIADAAGAELVLTQSRTSAELVAHADRAPTRSSSSTPRSPRR